MKVDSGNDLLASDVTWQDTGSLHLCQCLVPILNQGSITGAFYPMASFNDYFPEISLLSTPVRLRPVFSRQRTEMALGNRLLQNFRTAIFRQWWEATGLEGSGKPENDRNNHIP